VSRSVVVAAPAERIFDLLADPRAHVTFDGSGTVRGNIQGPSRLYRGAHFTVRMRMGLPYVIRSKVVEFEEGRLIAWRHPMRHRWRYRLEPVEGGTKVTETFDYSMSIAPAAMERAGFPERNADGIEKSLQRLKKLVEQRSEATAG